MKIGVVGILIFILVVIVLNSALILAVRINEVELNPAGEDSKNEWVELYSSSMIDLTEYTIQNVKGKNMSLNFSFSGYEVIIGAYNFLANDKQKLKLIDSNGNIIDETQEISDNSNDGRSWQYCSDEWVFKTASKGKENECGEKVIENDDSIVVENGTGQKKEDNNPDSNVNSKEKVVNDEEKTITSSAISNNLQEQDTAISKIEPIKLVPKGIKTYKSQTEYIKEYALYGFTAFCIVLLIILIKLRNLKISDSSLPQEQSS